MTKCLHPELRAVREALDWARSRRWSRKLQAGYDALDSLEEQLEAAQHVVDAAREHVNSPGALAADKKHADLRAAVDAYPAINRHGRDCRCTPCRAEDWDAIDAGLKASAPASRQDG